MKRGFVVYIAVFVVAAVVAASCTATGGPRPIGNVDTEQLQQMLNEKRGVALIDNRTEHEYRIGHIPGSINIPAYKLDSLNTLLPSDKKTHLIFYCQGTG